MKIPPIFLIAIGLATTAQAATIIEDFSGSTGNTPPSGWSITSGTYSTTAGDTGQGNAGTIMGTTSLGRISESYIVNSGSTSLDLRESITVTFDVMVSSNGNYESAAVMFGNVLTTPSGTNSGDLLSMSFGRNNFGNDDPEIVDGSGSILTLGENQQKVNNGIWYSATYTWTPTSGTTGDLSFTLFGAQNGDINLSTTGFTFSSPEAYFAFGDLDSDGANFDNINITGTAYVVPEPSVALLSGLGVLMLLRRRKS